MIPYTDFINGQVFTDLQPFDFHENSCFFHENPQIRSRKPSVLARFRSEPLPALGINDFLEAKFHFFVTIFFSKMKFRLDLGVRHSQEYI